MSFSCSYSNKDRHRNCVFHLLISGSRRMMDSSMFSMSQFKKNQEPYNSNPSTERSKTFSCKFWENDGRKRGLNVFMFQICLNEVEALLNMNCGLLKNLIGIFYWLRADLLRALIEPAKTQWNPEEDVSLQICIDEKSWSLCWTQIRKWKFTVQASLHHSMVNIYPIPLSVLFGSDKGYRYHALPFGQCRTF